MAVPDFSNLRDFYVGDQVFTGEYVQQVVSFGGNLDTEMKEVYAWMAFWGAVVADAKQLYDAKESAYRTARDRHILSRSTGDKKVAKTVAELEWRTLPEYSDWEQQKSESERAWNIAQAIHDACEKKANLLQSQAKLYLNESRAIGAGTSYAPGGKQ